MSQTENSEKNENVENNSNKQARPDEEIVQPSDALPKVSFNDLPEELQQAALKAGWNELMPVQAMAIPYVLAGRDIMVQSRTGSGKTGAFVLPMISVLDVNIKAPQALVLVPTRELAKQVAGEAEILGSANGLKSVAIYGGVGYGPQKTALQEGVQIVVGTPGRVLDHLLQGTLSLSKLRILVFDEADRMMSMGFYPDMKRVQGYLPKRYLSHYMFSATYPQHVIRLASQFLRQPELLSLSQDNVHVTETTHLYYEVPPMDKDRCLVRIIEMENPNSAIIFCNTRAQVHYVSVVLQRFGYDADELSAELTQRAREKVMKRIREGKLRFLVATDLAARGIDIPELSHVIQYDIPEDPEAYIHRAGRTGRAGAIGEAIALVAGTELIALKHIAQTYEIDLQERTMPSDSDVERIVSQRVIALLESKHRQRDSLQKERMQRFVPLARELAGSEDELSLLTMLLDDYYQESLHAIPPKVDEPDSPEESQSYQKMSGTKKHHGKSTGGKSSHNKRHYGKR